MTNTLLTVVRNEEGCPINLRVAGSNVPEINRFALSVIDAICVACENDPVRAVMFLSTLESPYQGPADCGSNRDFSEETERRFWELADALAQHEATVGEAIQQFTDLNRDGRVDAALDVAGLFDNEGDPFRTEDITWNFVGDAPAVYASMN